MEVVARDCHGRDDHAVKASSRIKLYLVLAAAEARGRFGMIMSLGICVRTAHRE